MIASGPRQLRSHGQRAMWEAVPEAEHGELRRRVGAMVRQMRDTAGRVSFTQEVRHTLGRR